jgi:FkbM family methyltransferase
MSKTKKIMNLGKKTAKSILRGNFGVELESKGLPQPESQDGVSGINLLIGSQPWIMSPEERAVMTVSCLDTDYIPKVANAGKRVSYNGQAVQIMHNGLKVLDGGYYGDWMAEIIKKLRGHHEPQEEKAFYEVINRLKDDKSKNKNMIELGSFWAYYSMWFKKSFPGASAYCFEPDPVNLELGKKNAALNSLELEFTEAAAGSDDGSKVMLNLESTEYEPRLVEIRSVDKFMADRKIPKLDILHMDVQGAELDTLKGAEAMIKAKKLRFIFVSTHHYVFSNDPLTHKHCADFIKQLGGHIISSHNVLESFSGDGLIVASFDDRDRDFHIDTSINTSQHSLFRSYEEDLGILLDELKKR